MHYERSIAIDRDLLDASGILAHEQVDVLTQYWRALHNDVIAAARGSRDISLNGAAARLVQTGDKVIIIAYCQVPAEEVRNYHPTAVLLGDGNRSRARLRPSGYSYRSASIGFIIEARRAG